MPSGPRILVVGLGGTIASSPLGTSGGSIPTLGSDALVEMLPSVESLASVQTIDEARVPSRALTPALICRLAHRIMDWRVEGFDAFVITQGTDTIEETAYALSLLIGPEIPIVVTGAMRTPSQPGTDGPANLLAAIQVATSFTTTNLGCVVLMQDEIHTARAVAKTHTTRMAAFDSPGAGPIGHVLEGRVVVRAATSSEDYLGLPNQLDQVRVELIWVASGSDGLIVDAVMDRADGLVIAGMGGGHVPPEMAGPVERAVQMGRHVVMSSRCGSGPTLTGTYDGVGSEIQLQEAGVLVAGELSPLKARLRLLVALSLGLQPRDVFPVW